MNKKLFVLAGEASGDLHGAGVLKRLKEKLPDIDIFGIGGTHIESTGARLIYKVNQINFMGFVEIAKHYPFLRKVMNEVKAVIKKEKPDCALLIDYPGMNLIIADFLKSQGIPVVFYVAPQVWAWKEGRVKKIREVVSRLCVVFDFEVDFFSKHGINAEFVGHPILEELDESHIESKSVFISNHKLESSTKLIGLLPGSRKQELDRIFPEMLKASERLQKESDVKFLLGKAPTIPDEMYQKFLSQSSIHPIAVSAYQVMTYSDLALVTSGTATLECLCFGTPMIVHYKTAALNYAIGKSLVKIEKIALANIISDGLYGNKKTVPELLQSEMSAENIYKTAKEILTNDQMRNEMRSKLLAAKSKLGSLKPAEEVSRIILEEMKSK